MTALYSPNPFFRVVDRLGDLYVSYRGRFVTMNQDASIFIQKHNVNGESVPVKLTNRFLCAHVNRQLAVSVYAGPYSAKFICFDVDDGSVETVRKIIDTCTLAGIPEEKIYVSTSGGKGYHVEIFFDSLVYVSTMKDFYDWVCFKADLDKEKVEFRPTHTGAIKLPLSCNFKTGNVCWYLDRDTMEPIQDVTYILTIEQMDAESFREISEEVRKECCAVNVHNDYDLNKLDAPSGPSQLADITIYDELPLLNRTGVTHKTILAIAIHLRKKKIPPEDAVVELLRWYKRQDKVFITDSDKTVLADIRNIIKWVYGGTYNVSFSRELYPTFNQKDMKSILHCETKAMRYVFFLLMYYFKRFGDANTSYSRIARICGISALGARKSVDRLIESDLVRKQEGPVRISENGFVKSANTYWPTGKSISLDVKFIKDDCSLPDLITPENFRQVYYTTLLGMVSRESLKQYLTRSEYKNLEEYHELQNQK